MNNEGNKSKADENQPKREQKDGHSKKVKDNTYTEGEQKFADGEGTKLDDVIDNQEDKG